MPYVIPPNGEWTPALVALNEPPVLDLEPDYEQRLQFEDEDRYRLVLGLGGIATEIRTHSKGIEEYLPKTYGTFVESREPRVRLSLGSVEDDYPFRTLIGTMMTYTRGKRVIGKFREMAGYVDTATGAGRGLILRDNYRQDVNNYLRMVIDAMTPPLDAILFHTAGIARDGHCYLFYGPSAAGKSTITKLAAQRYDVLTDDMLILRLEDGVIRAASCGFWGGETKAYPTKKIDLPVKGFFRLKKGEKNRARRLDPIEAALEIVCGIPSMERPKRDYRFILDLASEAVARTPSYELEFHKEDDSFWGVIDELD